MKKIMFATDGSDSALNAASVAKQWMTSWPDAEVEIIYVTQVFSSGFGSNVPVDFADEIAKDVEERSRAIFADMADKVSFRHLTNVASPGVVLSDIAKAEGFDLIVVGSHGRNAVNRFLLGSVSNGLVNRSEVPVLVVRK